LTKGETITLTSDYDYKGDNKKLACSYETLASSVKPGQSILVADGSLVLTVVSTDVAAGEAVCRIENDCSIGERKNMNLPGVVVDLPTLTDKDVDDIVNWGIKNDIDYIAASFVRKADDVHFIRKILGDKDGHIKIYCKIENQEGMENYSEILQVTDGIMVARGGKCNVIIVITQTQSTLIIQYLTHMSLIDLGMEIPPEKVFLAQKMMIREANIAGKPVITATQMLESMIVNPRPTRAECSDVANAVLDGTDCVMLSGETANGEHPVAAVTIMARTCVEAESAVNFDSLYQAVRNSTLNKFGHLSTSESIASSAVKTAIDVKAKAIIVMSESGNTARQVAKFRPGMPVKVITTSHQVARQCFGSLKGCTGHPVDSMEMEQAGVDAIIAELKATGKAQAGDPVVIVHGTVAKAGATNTMKIEYV
jgi:pyruvate kinase